MTQIWKRVKNKRVWKVDRSIYLKDFVVARAVRGLFPKTGVFFLRMSFKSFSQFILKLMKFSLLNSNSYSVDGVVPLMETRIIYSPTISR